MAEIATQPAPTARYRRRLADLQQEQRELLLSLDKIVADGADDAEIHDRLRQVEEDIRRTQATLAASERADAASAAGRAQAAKAKARKAAEKAWDEAADEALKAEALLAKFAQQWGRYEEAYRHAAQISPDRDAVEGLHHPYRPSRVFQILFSELRRLVRHEFPATLMTATPQGWNLSQMLGRKRATLMPWLKK